MMIAICITNIIFGITSVLIMLYVLKVNFERKDDMLKLFQFGLTGALTVNLLNAVSMTCEYYLGKHQPSTSDIYNYLFNMTVCFLVIPYFLFARRKKKLG